MSETVIVAGGCFWCTEAVFKDVIGVESVESGYIGGEVENPTYKEVCTGSTGHAEGVKVTFDPETVSLPEIYDMFMGTHDPSQLNRQGNDVGTQYRSAIFPLSDAQQGRGRSRHRALERGPRCRCRDHDRKRHLVSGRGLPPGILGGRRPAESLLHGRDPAQADEAAEELCRQGEELTAEIW